MQQIYHSNATTNINIRTLIQNNSVTNSELASRGIHRTKLTPLRGVNLAVSTGTLIYCHSGGC